MAATKAFDLNRFLATRTDAVNAALDKFLPSEKTKPATIHKAMRYSLFAGGKRMRPAVLLAAARCLPVRYSTSAPVAALRTSSDFRFSEISYLNASTVASLAHGSDAAVISAIGVAASSCCFNVQSSNGLTVCSRVAASRSQSLVSFTSAAVVYSCVEGRG